jgi:hypothetical protein
MKYAICTVSAAPVRKEDAHRSEMTSQLLFGETMEVLEEKGDWLRIKSMHDGYEGWLTHHLVEEIEELFAITPVQFVTTGLVNPLTLPNELVNLPMGSSLTGYDEETRLLWDGQHKYHGTYRNVKDKYDLDLLWRTVHAWINAPYLWGGRTFMGVDCSGFVQVVFKVLGISLLRDAYQQATQGTAVENLADAKAGDVAFFHNEAGKIIHVGILLSNEEIIHASGKVRVDKINTTGIINSANGKRTHQLNCIRSFL